MKVVDFTSVDQIAKAIEGASSLISFAFTADKQEHVNLHRNLIKACQQAGVKRYVPSEWAGDVTM